MNHVDMETTCWIMVHEQTGIIAFSSLKENGAGLTSPNFSRSHLERVYITKKISETSSARLEPIAAPVIPSAGTPKCPNIRIQLKPTLDATITMEFNVKALVWVVPT